MKTSKVDLKFVQNEIRQRHEQAPHSSNCLNHMNIFLCGGTYPLPPHSFFCPRTGTTVVSESHLNLTTLGEQTVDAQLTSFPARTADEALKSYPMDQQHSSVPCAVLIYSLRQAVTPHGVFLCIPFPIEKRVVFSGIIYLSRMSPNFFPSRQVHRQVSNPGTGAFRHSMLNLVKLSSQPSD
ncbi:hypothetical protein AVEN_125001-1 [Araneus ventricosus]|uniref:Uncharacterized protein n=1 Tax=Araneus ventricosus TaxID=182803 RepID=A0A4Y2EFU3_ARAVE|nr:hypothetical protein AVEN_125001-1 [Araneus ventricosus]